MVQVAAEEMLGEKVAPDSAFPAGSFDSNLAVELASSISQAAGIDLSSTLVFDYPSIAAIAGHIHSLLAAANFPGHVTALSQMQTRRECSTDALVQLQISDRTPSLRQAPDTPAGIGRDAVSVVSYSRWDIDGLRDGKSVLRVRFSGFIDGVEAFDAAAFGITPPEAQIMDPQQRLLMEVCNWPFVVCQ